MSSASPPPSQNRSFAALRRFVRERKPVERCELCSAEVAALHSHLLEPAQRKLICACQPCAILFDGHAEKKYKRVPYRVRRLENFQLTDAQWDSLMIPIHLAFFFRSTPDARIVALYPSPAGATESLLSLDSWAEIVQDNAAVGEMEADVEALLVNRVGTAREHYLVPIDECYKLIGLIRLHWRGLSGGTEVWDEIARFFTALRKRSEASGESARA